MEGRGRVEAPGTRRHVRPDSDAATTPEGGRQGGARSALRVRLEEGRDLVIAVAERHGASNVRVFGSVARGDDVEGSDVDLLVDLREGVTLFALARMRSELAAVLGASVDVVSAAALLPRDADILAEAWPL